MLLNKQRHLHMRASCLQKKHKQQLLNTLLISAILTVLLSGGCGKATPTDKSIIWLDSKHQVTLLDSAAAASALLTDSSDLYFEQVTIQDMQWQMRELTPDSQRQAVLERYKRWLPSEAANFSSQELLLVSAALRRAHRMMMDQLPGLFPASCQLARIKGLAYGPDAYFTRGDVIFIAPGMLATNDPDQLADLLVHEVWHLVSRASLYKAGQLGPDTDFPQPASLRDKTYQAVGFTRVEGQLTMPAADRASLVLNPDATFAHWAIQLQAATDTAARYYLPLLRLSPAMPQPGQERSLAHAIDLAYCPLSPTAEGWHTSLAEAVDPGTDPDFLSRTGGNTPYILHPEEIVAENMLLLARGDQASAGTQGQVVLDSLRNVLWQWVKYEKQLSRRR